MDWDDQLDTPEASTTETAKKGLGRGSLAVILGQKVRGIGRGSVDAGHVNGFSCGQPAEDSSATKVNGFGGSRRENGAGFGNRTTNGDCGRTFDEDNGRTSRGGFGGGRDNSSSGFAKSSGSFQGGFDGSNDSSGFTKKSGGFSQGGFGGGFNTRERNDDSSESTGKSNGFSRGGFGGGFNNRERNDSEDSAGLSRKPNGFSRGGFGGGGFDNKERNNSEDSAELSKKPNLSFRGGFGGGFNNRESNDSEDSSEHSRKPNGFSRGGFGGGGFGSSNSRKNDTSDDGGDSEFRGSAGERSGFGSSRPERGGRPGGFGRGGRRTAGETSEKSEESEDGKPPVVSYIPPAPSDKEEDIFHSAVHKGINFDKYDDIPVEVSGRDQCGLINCFEEAGFFPTFLRNIQRAGYDKPTPIQKYAIPIIMAGRDLMACAQTGSGKTAAFLLPMLTAVVNQGLATDRHQRVQTPQAICVAPTRELAIQIYTDCRKFSYQTEIRPVVVYGGTSLGHQMRQVESGANIVIGTPGRLLDVINRGKISLAKVSFLILDEADRMLDMGFESEIRKLVETMGMPPKTERQTLMFSATFPEEIQKLAADFLNDYLFVTVGRVGGANTDVSQHFFEVERLQKRDSLCDILNASVGEKTLVFVEMKRNADFLASYLCQSGFPTTSIHGDRLQKEREEALADFKSGKAHVLVATSVAARGLDIPEVMHVVNYDLPSSIDEYVHRIGRTGRCGNLGKATSFFNADTDQPMAPHLVRILKEAQQLVPDWLVAHSCGMGAGDPTTFAGRFGGKDIRRGKFDAEGRSGAADDNWAAGAGADLGSGGVDDEQWD